MTRLPPFKEIMRTPAPGEVVSSRLSWKDHLMTVGLCAILVFVFWPWVVLVADIGMWLATDRMRLLEWLGAEYTVKRVLCMVAWPFVTGMVIGKLASV